MPIVSKLSAVWQLPGGLPAPARSEVRSAKFVADDQAQAVLGRQVALVVDRKIAQSCRVLV